jgi:hypothetical protein
MDGADDRRSTTWLRALGRVDADDARRVVADDFAAVGRPGGRDDHVPGLGIERLDVVLGWVVDVHLLHLPVWVRDEVDLDVIEPDPFVLVGRAGGR